MKYEMRTSEFTFKNSINLMIAGLIQEDIDLEDALYWLKDIVGDYEEEIKRQSEPDYDIDPRMHDGQEK
jgi:hypothetical protein